MSATILTPRFPNGRNLVAALVRLERSRSGEDAEAALGALDAWLSESGNEALRRAVGEWMRRVYAPGRPAVVRGPEAENRLEARIMLRERVQEWNRQLLEEGRIEGRAEGRTRQVELMRRMAVRKFGGETAERLAEKLEPVHDAEQLVEIGEWLIECESGEELLARLKGEHPLPGRLHRNPGLVILLHKSGDPRRQKSPCRGKNTESLQSGPSLDRPGQYSCKYNYP